MPYCIDVSAALAASEGETMTRTEYQIVRDNTDNVLAYAASERIARHLKDEMNEDEASYQGCAVSDLEYPAYVRAVTDEGDGFPAGLTPEQCGGEVMDAQTLGMGHMPELPRPAPHPPRKVSSPGACGVEAMTTAKPLTLPQRCALRALAARPSACLLSPGQVRRQTLDALVDAGRATRVKTGRVSAQYSLVRLDLETCVAGDRAEVAAGDGGSYWLTKQASGWHDDDGRLWLESTGRAGELYLDAWGHDRVLARAIEIVESKQPRARLEATLTEAERVGDERAIQDAEQAIQAYDQAQDRCCCGAR